MGNPTRRRTVPCAKRLTQSPMCPDYRQQRTAVELDNGR